MDNVMLIFTTGTGVTIISFLVQILVTLSASNPKWGLNKALKLGNYEISKIKLIGFVLSLLGSIALSVSQGYYNVAIMIGGAIGIFCTEFGVGKLVWKNIFKLLYKIANKKMPTVEEISNAIDDITTDVNSFKTKDSE